ncbi:hypothetical protein OSB04_030371 [Centaurea solstitialis]|uniref:Nuclease associated modular domain-containing protein n=1 Tax=Centaurea solstitialis TaxID=347529 RepID=A0AA38SSR9_9ASTR|nr:hypothetical protein OSB04_030371 [Centaurea solstitialis]
MFADIATPQPSFRSSLYSLGFQPLHHHHHHHVSRWRYFHKPNRIIIKTLDISSSSSAGLMIKAVATLEPRCSPSDNKKENGNAQQQQQQLSIDSNQTSSSSSSSILDEKETLRRKRISKANKGKEAWNKGLRHTPVFLLVLAVSRETRLKIGASVRLTWDRNRIKRRMISRCHREWLNLLAEASRKGLYGEQELQWDSYDTINEQLEKIHQKGVESRRRPKSTTPGKRIPKTLEQRRKISEAIAAKWADPIDGLWRNAYRDRVQSGMAKRYERSSVTRDPTKKKEPKKIKAEKKKEPRVIRASRPKVKKISSQARYKDPQAGYKLEMIKSIRAQRAGSDPKIREAVTRANVLIAEAQRAAEALEVAAAKNPMAEASLVETRKLIAEAISYIESIEMLHSPSPDVKTEIEQRGGVNGVGSLGLSDAGIGSKHVAEDMHVVANGKEHINVSSSSASSWGLQVEEDVGRTMASEEEEKGSKGRKRWVCGRLVEDDDDEEEEEEQ